jgi:hypothetical protein
LLNFMLFFFLIESDGMLWKFVMDEIYDYGTLYMY